VKKVESGMEGYPIKSWLPVSRIFDSVETDMNQ
jgi:hypothetical protein